MEYLIEIFGKVGSYYYGVARGIDHRPVEPRPPRKSVGSENTFERDLHERHLMLEHLNEMAVKVARMLVAHQISGRTVTVKVKYADFTQATRSCTLADPLSGLKQLRSLLPELLSKTDTPRRRTDLCSTSVYDLSLIHI